MINAYRNAIRDRIEQRLNAGDVRQFMAWDVMADEARDATLLSQRAYGSRQHVDVVLVACGASGIWEQLEKKRIALPLLSDVIALRNEYLGK